jgi:hypothetical protein
MKRAVSISLGSPKRDKQVMVALNGVPICAERIGTGGDAHKARQLFAELDGKVDCLSVGGIDLYVRLDGRDYPVRSALPLVQEVRRTPLVDGRLLKYVLERRVFELARPVLGDLPRFRGAFQPFTVDRIGLAEAVSAVSDQVIFGDLMFMFGLPLPVRGLGSYKRLLRILMPAAGYLPLSMLYPPGARDDTPHPKYARFWEEADLIAGDMHYIHKYSSPNLGGKWVVTNTTTPENIELLRERGVSTVITVSPRWQGRSFGTNMMEAVLVAYAGKGRALTPQELEALVDEVQLKPEVIDLAKVSTGQAPSQGYPGESK